MSYAEWWRVEIFMESITGSFSFVVHGLSFILQEVFLKGIFNMSVVYTKPGPWHCNWYSVFNFNFHMFMASIIEYY